VACDLCRVKIGQPVSVSGTKKPKALEVLIESSLGTPEAPALRREPEREPESAVIKVR